MQLMFFTIDFRLGMILEDFQNLRGQMLHGGGEAVDEPGRPLRLVVFHELQLLSTLTASK